MRPRTLAATVLVAGAVIALVLIFAREDEEASPVLVDERIGVLHGVRFGDGEREVRELLGEENDDRDGFFPEGADYTGPFGSWASDGSSRPVPPERSRPSFG